MKIGTVLYQIDIGAIAFACGINFSPSVECNYSIKSGEFLVLKFSIFF